MDPNCPKGPPPRVPPPKDGIGPRGVPEVYYTSRVLDSTAHYVRFVKKLRALEEEQRKGRENALEQLKIAQTNSFFTKCDRKGLVQNVARRVDLCLASYEDDLQQKRGRLKQLLAVEEEANIRKFAVQAQEGVELLWKDTLTRLDYLLAKRKKEHEDRFKDTPLSKCAHVHPCIVKLRAKEAEEIQLYQMREKKMRKMAEQEMDKMWYEVAMKEADALASRMEYDVMERLRRDRLNKEYTDVQLEMRRQQRERDREILKQEALALKADTEEYFRQQAEIDRKKKEAGLASGQARREMMKEQEEEKKKQEAQAKIISDTWDSIANQGLQADLAKEEERRQKERDLDVCNKKLVEMKNRIAVLKVNNEPLIEEEGRMRRDAVDLKRCQWRKWTKQNTKDVSENALAIIKEKEAMKGLPNEEEGAQEEYNRQQFKHLEELVKHKQLTDAQARKLHQRDLLGQIDYNKLLKERALKEELEQRKKCAESLNDYQDQIKAMLSRRFFSDDVHPFMKQMASGLQLSACECGDNYCAKPPPKPKKNTTE
ncbi:uncharacterized protein LOC142983170 [Anticarsia gemmatalis]|uniref:uncharacterized protein LOC142983170 n=1 Tax=Anticarsia gemmatalis TaxID=129554 RepID=UPI003F759005